MPCDAGFPALYVPGRLIYGADAIRPHLPELGGGGPCNDRRTAAGLAAHGGVFERAHGTGGDLSFFRHLSRLPPPPLLSPATVTVPRSGGNRPSRRGGAHRP